MQENTVISKHNTNKIYWLRKEKTNNMETKMRNRLLSVALLLLFALPASAQSITFTTTKNVGEKITLTIKATNGPVTATGLTEKIVADASEQSYTLTSQTITLDGPIEVFKCDRIS